MINNKRLVYGKHIDIEVPFNWDKVHPQVKYLYDTVPYQDQGSDLWFNTRLSRLTASDVPTILGKCKKYGKDADGVFKSKTSPSDGQRFNNYYTRHGNENEKIALQLFVDKYNKIVIDFGLIPSEKISFLGASPDGVTTTGELVEIKCPVTREIKTEEEYQPYGCPEHYYDQVQTQLWCADLKMAFFVEYLKPSMLFDEPLLSVSRVYRSDDWYNNNIPVLKTFWDLVLEYRKHHPDWQRVNHYPAKPEKKRILKLYDEKKPNINLFKVGTFDNYERYFV